MRNLNWTEIKVSKGRFTGEVFLMENELKDMPGGEEDLAYLATTGNWAAKNALSIDHYTVEDGPFYYGKIANAHGVYLGYIISHEDLYGNKKDNG